LQKTGIVSDLLGEGRVSIEKSGVVGREDERAARDGDAEF